MTAWSKAAEEGNASKGPRHRGRFLDGPSGPRPSGRRLGCEAESGSPKRGEPHGRLRGATNPRTVERVDLRICSLRRKPLKPGGTAGAEHDRDVAVPIRSLGDGPGGGRRSDGCVDEGAIDEPQERSPETSRSIFGSTGTQLDRANRYASEQESRRCLDPMRSIYDRCGKDQRTTLHEVPATTRHGLDLGCEIALERRRDNLERPWAAVRRPTPGS